MAIARGLDARPVAAYLVGMATRLLLTLLALLTGLATQFTPAQARGGASAVDVQIGISASVSAPRRVATTRGKPTIRLVELASPVTAASHGVLRAPNGFSAPVLPGIDRARE